MKGTQIRDKYKKYFYSSSNLKRWAEDIRVLKQISQNTDKTLQ